jgi:pimeloyl-ACP methyl ester carboxylesterase
MARLLACLTALILVLALPGAAAARDKPAEKGDAAKRPKLTKTACPWQNKLRRRVECYWLAVPEDRTKADSRKIQLFAAVFRSPKKSILAPVVLVGGGPGATAGLDRVGGDYWNREVRRLTWLGNRDLIVYEQRGVGVNRPSITCPELIVSRADPVNNKLYMMVLRKCASVWRKRGLAFAAYDTNANVADLEDLRRALGYRRWVLWGQSYGTRVSLATARRFPAGVSGLILDGVFPPQIGPKLHWATGTIGAIDRIFAACAADKYCGKRYPNLWPRFEALLRRLAVKPVVLPSKTKPVLPDTSHRIDDVLFMSVIESSLYTGEGALKLPWLIDQLDRKNNWAALQGALAEWDQFAFGPFITAGVNLLVDCNDNPNPDASAERALAEKRPALRRWIRFITEVDVCALWTATKTPALDFSPVRSNVPAILISGMGQAGFGYLEPGHADPGAGQGP